MSLPWRREVKNSSGVSQHRPVDALSCTSGTMEEAEIADVGCRVRKRSDPFPFTLIFDLPAAPLVSVMAVSPLVVPALRIPGGGSKSSDCLFETAVDIQTPTLKRDGTPSNKQICVDDDPTCDFDPNAGSCRFHAWLCFGGGDARLSCTADSVAQLELRKPSEKEQGDLAALRQAVVERLGAFTLPLPAGERCTTRIDVDVPAGRKDGKLSLRVRNQLGARDTDNLKFKCTVPKP